MRNLIESLDFCFPTLTLIKTIPLSINPIWMFFWSPIFRPMKLEKNTFQMFGCVLILGTFTVRNEQSSVIHFGFVYPENELIRMASSKVLPRLYSTVLIPEFAHKIALHYIIAYSSDPCYLAYKRNFEQNTLLQKSKNKLFFKLSNFTRRFDTFLLLYVQWDQIEMIKEKIKTHHQALKIKPDIMMTDENLSRCGKLPDSHFEIERIFNSDKLIIIYFILFL